MKGILTLIGYVLLAVFTWKVLTDPSGAADIVESLGTKIGWALGQMGIFSEGVAT